MVVMDLVVMMRTMEVVAAMMMMMMVVILIKLAGLSSVHCEGNCISFNAPPSIISHTGV